MQAIVWMIVSTVIYGFYPLIAYIGSITANPIVIVALAHTAASLFQLAAFLIACSFENRNPWAVMQSALKYSTLKYWAISQGLVHAIAHTSLFAAFMYLDKYAAALIYDAWPIVMILLSPLILKGKKHPSPKDWIFIALSFIGLFIILESKIMYGAIDAFDEISRGSQPLIGAALSVIALMAMAYTSTVAVKLEQLCASAYNLKWHLSQMEDTANGETLESRQLPYSTAILASLLGNGASIIFVAATLVALTATGTTDFSLRGTTSDFLLVSGVAGIIAAGGAIAFILANRLSDTSTVNILFNLTPLFGILFLYIFGADQRIDAQILIGGMLVIAANLAVSVQIQITSAYYVSILTICAAAVYCFFIPGIKYSRIL